MPNMSYCRFQNTVSDLEDCFNALERLQDYEYERTQFRKLLKKESLKDGRSDAVWDEMMELEGKNDSEGVWLSSDEVRCAKKIMTLCKRFVDELDHIDLDEILDPEDA